MKLFGKKTGNMGEDVIPDKIHKRLHNLYFIVKAIMFAYVFLFFWNTICNILLDAPDTDDTERSAFLQHDYCGTFFIEINAENSFASQEDYEAYINEYLQAVEPERSQLTDIISAVGTVGIILLVAAVLTNKGPKFLKNRYIMLGLIIPLSWLAAADISLKMPLTAVLIITLIFAMQCGDKKKIFSDRASEYFLICGTVWLIQNITELFRPFETKYMTGIYAHPVRYIQLYRIALIPVTVFCIGLILKRHELDLKHADIKNISRVTKLTCGGLAAGTAAFLIYRLPVRIYELIKVYTDSSYSVKLPFTVMENPYDSKLIALPRGLANSDAVYSRTILYRFIKDFPVFILSSIAIVYFIRVMLAVSRGELNTAANRKRLNISMLILAAASVWFNLMGIPELGLYNNGFTGIYGEVVYTIALRSMTEPAMYVLGLLFLKTFLQAIPETQTADADNAKDNKI